MNTETRQNPIRITREGHVYKTTTIGLTGHPRFGEQEETLRGTVVRLTASETGTSAPAFRATRGLIGRGGQQRTFDTRRDAVAWLTA